jgi:hydrogenase nickel incorporation protein HypB
MSTRIVELRKNLLNKNDVLAQQLRERFRAAGCTVFNWVSSPGTGKTELLKKVLIHLVAEGLRPAALVGDLETDNDARRLAESGAPARQIETHTLCHLEAERVGTWPKLTCFSSKTSAISSVPLAGTWVKTCGSSC